MSGGAVPLSPPSAGAMGALTVPGESKTPHSLVNTPTVSIKRAASSQGGDKQKAEDEAHATEYKEKCVTGAVFLKHGRSGAPHKRYFLFTPDLVTIRWDKDAKSAAKETASGIFVSGITDVVPGRTTDVFKRAKQKDRAGSADAEQKEQICFSVLHRERTLDLECSSETERNEWISLIKWAKRCSDRASLPTNVKHVTHVNQNLEWSGVNLKEAFELKQLLGEGSFGQVYRAIHTSSKLEMAIKMIYVENQTTITEIQAEVDILKLCRHPNVVGFFGCWGPDEQQRLWILMEICSKGSVVDLMKQYDILPTEKQIAFITAAVLKALNYLHTQKKIFHRDIKGGNILLTADGGIKVTDFGISKKMAGTTKGTKAGAAGGAGGGGGGFELPAGSPLWMAPEIVTGKNPSYSADIWSLGVTCIEMAEGDAPYADKQVFSAMKEIVRNPPPTLAEPDKWSPEFRDFLKQCLVKDATQRPTAAQLLSHPWIVSALTGIAPSSVVVAPASPASAASTTNTPSSPPSSSGGGAVGAVASPPSSSRSLSGSSKTGGASSDAPLAIPTGAVVLKSLLDPKARKPSDHASLSKALAEKKEKALAKSNSSTVSGSAGGSGGGAATPSAGGSKNSGGDAKSSSSDSKAGDDEPTNDGSVVLQASDMRKITEEEGGGSDDEVVTNANDEHAQNFDNDDPTKPDPKKKKDPKFTVANSNFGGGGDGLNAPLLGSKKKDDSCCCCVIC